MFDGRIKDPATTAHKGADTSPFDLDLHHYTSPQDGKYQSPAALKFGASDTLANNDAVAKLPTLAINWDGNQQFQGFGGTALRDVPAALRHEGKGSQSDDLADGILKSVPKESDRAQLKTAIETFRHNRLENPRSPISEQEYKTVLKDVATLLSPDEKFKHTARLNADDRTLLAKQILSLASTPQKADQGRFNTCEMATLEKVLWAREPSAVSGLITKAALEGKIENVHSHTTFSLSSTPFTKNLEGPDSTSHPKGRERLFASQIFQTSLIEREWASRDIGFGAGALEYKLTKPTNQPGDGGERLVMKYGPNKGKVLYDNDDNVPITDPGMDFSRIGKIYDSIAKKPLNGEPIVLAAQDGKSYLDRSHRDGIGFVNGPADLAKKLAGLQDRHQLPIIIAVVDRDGDNKDLHVITIRDYDRRRNVLTVDDQLGPHTKGQLMTPGQLLTRGHKNTMITEDLKPWQLPHANVRLQREKHL